MPSPSTAVSRLRIVETALAAVVLATTAIEFGGSLQAYPTWVYLGDVTLPVSVFAPTALGVVALAEVSVAARDDAFGRRETATGVLGTLVVVTAAYAVLTLNVAEPGVFFAGVFPMLFGLLLAVGVLADGAVAAVRGRPTP